MSLCDDGYDIGDQPIWRATLRDLRELGGVSTAIEYEVRQPDGDVLTFTDADSEVVAVDDNIWDFYMPVLDTHGDWRVRATSTAGLIASITKRFTVRKSWFS